MIDFIKSLWPRRKAKRKVTMADLEKVPIIDEPDPHVVKQIEKMLPPDDVLDEMSDDEAIAYGLNQLFKAEEKGFAEYRNRRRKARDKIRTAVAKDGVQNAKIDDTY